MSACFSIAEHGRHEQSNLLNRSFARYVEDSSKLGDAEHRKKRLGGVYLSLRLLDQRNRLGLIDDKKQVLEAYKDPFVHKLLVKQLAASNRAKDRKLLRDYLASDEGDILVPDPYLAELGLYRKAVGTGKISPQRHPQPDTQDAPHHGQRPEEKTGSYEKEHSRGASSQVLKIVIPAGFLMLVIILVLRLGKRK